MADHTIYAKPYAASEHRIEVLVRENRRNKLLFYEADRPVWQTSLLNDDFALIALCQYCSARKKDLFIEGRVTKSALTHIEEFLQIWSVWAPERFFRIKLDVAEIVDDIPNRDLPAVLAFSGGVDASFSLAAHESGLLGRLNRKIGLGVMIVGFDLPNGDTDAVNNAYRAVETSLGDPFGIPAVAVNTNWQPEFCPEWEWGYNAGVTAVLHLFSNHYASGIFSSDYNYREELNLEPRGSHMIINHLLGSYTFPIINTGGTHTRLQKIRFLKEFPGLIERLRVCWQIGTNGKNCGECEKCDRTRLELLLSGIDADIFEKPYNEARLRKIELSEKLLLMFYEDLFAHSQEGGEIHSIAKEILERESVKFDAAPGSHTRQSREAGKWQALVHRKRNELRAALQPISWRIKKLIRRVIK